MPTLFVALVGAALAASRPAHAQRTGEEWMEQHAHEAAAEVRTARGALPLLRMWSQHDYVDPVALVERFHAVAADPHAPAMRRALALFLERGSRAELGQRHEADQITTQLGFLTRWLVVGPFGNEGRAGFSHALPPETDRGHRPDPGEPVDGHERPVRWRLLPEITRGGYVPLDAIVHPAQNACAFAHTTVTSPRDADGVLWLGASGQVRAYVNTVEVFRDEVVRSAFPDRAGVRVRLHRGANRVLLEVCTDSHPLGFYARFTSPDGAPLAGLASDPDPANAPEQNVAPAQANAPAPHAPVLGVLAELRAPAEVAHPTAQALEDYARFLSLTGSDNAAQPTAADVAQRAAEMAPTWQRWLMVADRASDRNRRLAAFARAQALAPDDAHVLAALGHERRLGAHPEDALPLLDRATALDDGYVFARLERALVLAHVGLTIAAYHDVTEALERAPRAPLLLRFRAQMAEEAQLYDEASAMRRAYVRVHDDDAEAHEALARDARSRGDRETVRIESERMVAAEPARLGAYSASAELLEAIGEGEAAVGLLTRATEIAPDDPEPWKTRGELEVRLGHRDEGRADMRRALALSPQDSTLRRHVEALEPPVARPDEILAEAPAAFLARRVAVASSGYRSRSLSDLTVRTVYPNGLAGTFRQTVFQVLTEEGAQAARSFPIQYEPDSQHFELRAARVYHPDGSIDESARMDEYMLTGGASRMFYDARAMVVSFPSLSPGDVIEVRWRLDDVSQRNAFSDYFGDLAVLQSDAPRARVRYVLRAPAARQLYFHIPQLATLQHSERVDGALRVYDFLATDVPAVPPEDHAPGSTERAAYIHVSTYRTWEDVGRWYWGLIHDQLQADDRVRSIVQEITNGLTTPQQRIRAIYDWVIHNTRYVALEFGIHGFLPYRVPEICSRGFGDCKDKASTIVTMLREVGIDASIALVRTRNNGNIATSPASLAVFDHAIAYVPPFEGYPQGLFLDGTAQSSGMDELPPGDQGAMALVVNQRGEAHLATIPFTPADHNVTDVRSELTVEASGAATLRSVHDVHGPNAGGLRAVLESQGTRVERIEGQLAASYPGVRVTDVRTNDMNDVDHAAHLEYDAQIPELGTRQGPTVLFAPLAPVNFTREYAGRSTRTTDVMISGPSTLDEQRTIHLPAGASVVELPTAATIDSPYFHVELAVEHPTQRPPGVITVHRTIVTRVDRVPVADYAAFRQACQRIDDALGRRAIVRLAGGAGPSAAANGGAQ